MSRRSRSRRTLDTLLADAGIRDEIVSVELLDIGWPGRGEGTYRDDDGTHSRVRLTDGTSVIYREYATTTGSSARYLAKEAFVFKQLAKAGLPTPPILAEVDGSEGTGGDPPAMLLADPGGESLETVFRDVPKSQRAALWSEVGSMLRRLHRVDLSYAGPLADPSSRRSWMDFVPYFAKSLRGMKKRFPETAPQVDELLILLRKQVAPYLEDRPRAICFGHTALPALMLERYGKSWRCLSWLSLGYYVSVGDPDRDVVSTARRCRQGSGSEVPDSFYKAYGRRPDPVCAVLYEIGSIGPPTRGPDGSPSPDPETSQAESVARLRELLMKG